MLRSDKWINALQSVNQISMLSNTHKITFDLVYCLIQPVFDRNNDTP